MAPLRALASRGRLRRVLGPVTYEKWGSAGLQGPRGPRGQRVVVPRSGGGGGGGGSAMTGVVNVGGV